MILTDAVHRPFLLFVCVLAMALATPLSGAYPELPFAPGHADDSAPRSRALDSQTGTQRQDFLIPDRTAFLTPPPLNALAPRPFGALDGSGSPGVSPSTVSSSTGVDSNELRVSHEFTTTPVLIGDTLSATISVKNLSQQPLHDLPVEIYFILEESDLLAAPSQCRRQLSFSLQVVLACNLGDFAAGESKAVNYTIRPTLESPSILFATVLAGETRVDDWVSLVPDVRSDSDGDGMSDFNENLLGTDPLDAGSVDSSVTVIDVMTLYTPGTKSLYPFGVETRINHLIGTANQVYADSGVAIRLRPVYQGLIDYNDDNSMDAAMDDLLARRQAPLDRVDALRDFYGADLVMLLQPMQAGDERCGLAALGGFGTGGYFDPLVEREFGFSVIGIDCTDDLIVAHEVGHNLGLTHSHREDGTGGTFEFATGFGVDNAFVTVMARPSAFNVWKRTARFSSPDLLCRDLPCGLAEGKPSPADAVRTLNTVRHQIAAYSQRRVPFMPQRNLTATSDQPTSARITLGASIDASIGYVETAETGQRVDVRAEVKPDPAHLGAEGSVHALIRTRDFGLFQVDELGRLLNWDGSIDSLAAVYRGAMRPVETISVLQDFVFDASAAGQVLEFFVAYQLRDSAEVVFTEEPLVLRIEAAD